MTPQFLKIDGHLINIADISTISPVTGVRTDAGALADGLKVTLMSKGTWVFLPGLDAEAFMDRLAGSIRINMPADFGFDDGDDDHGDSDPDGGSK